MCCCRGGVSSCGDKGGFHGGRCGFHLFIFLPWGGGVNMGFGLGMFFVVVVVAGGCRGDLDFCSYLGFGIYYFIMKKYYFKVLYC